MYVDVLDEVAAGFLVAADNGAERGEVDLVGRFPRIAATDEDVQRGKLADHLSDDIIQLIAIRHAIDEREIAVADGFPVESVRVAVVEVVALEAPGVEEQFVEFGLGTGRETPARDVDF